MILGSLNLFHVVLAGSSDKIIVYITDQLFLLSRSYKGQLMVKQNVAYYASNCTRFIYIRLWGLLETFSDLFHACPQFLAMKFEKC